MREARKRHLENRSGKCAWKLHSNGLELNKRCHTQFLLFKYGCWALQVIGNPGSVAKSKTAISRSESRFKLPTSQSVFPILLEVKNANLSSFTNSPGNRTRETFYCLVLAWIKRALGVVKREVGNMGCLSWIKS